MNDRDTQGMAWGERPDLPFPLQVHHSPQSSHVPQPGSSLNLVLWIFSEASLQRHDSVTGLWQRIQPPAALPSPEVGRWD